MSGRDLAAEVTFLTRALKAPTLREAATCSSAEMVWWRAQTRSWSATIRPAQSACTR